MSTSLYGRPLPQTARGQRPSWEWAEPAERLAPDTRWDPANPKTPRWVYRHPDEPDRPPIPLRDDEVVIRDGIAYFIVWAPQPK